MVTMTHAASKEGFSGRRITIVVGTSPGGMVDMSSRAFAPSLEKHFGVPVIVENKPGADFMVAAEYVRSAPKDGTTLFVISSPAGYLNAKNLERTWDFRKEFVPVGSTGREPFMVSALPSRFSTLNDLISEAKAKGITFTVTGMKSVDTFNTILTARAMGIIDNMTMVPFSSGGEAFAAVQGGHVDSQIRCGGLYMRQQEVKLLAVTASERVPGVIPDGETSHVPTIEEVTGNKLDLSLMYTTFVHSATPDNIVAELREAFKQIYSDPEVIKKLNRGGLAAKPVVGEELVKAIQELWNNVDKNYDLVYSILKEKERK